MKHLIKKLTWAGGKSKPRPQPAVLNPPKLGVHQLAASFSYAEILDLISDGPIEGLVNKNGSLLRGPSILQGIYLDNTPVAVTNDDAIADFTPDLLTGATNSIAAAIVSDVANQTLSQKIDVDTFKQSPVDYTATWELGGRSNNNREDQIELTNFTDIIDDSTPFIYLPPLFKHNSEDIYFACSSLSLGQLMDICAIEDIVSPPINEEPTDSYQIKYNRSLLQERFGPVYSDTTTALRNYLSTVGYWGGVPATQLLFKNNLKPCLIIKGSALDFTSSYDPNLFINGANSIDTDLRFGFTSTSKSLLNRNFHNFLVPNLAEDGTWDGTVGGFCIFFFDALWSQFNASLEYNIDIVSIKSNLLKSLIGLTAFGVKNPQQISIANNQKFNFSNILAEFKDGQETQEPFKYFNKVFIDKEYGETLLGPFNVNNTVQTIQLSPRTLRENFALSITGVPEMDASNALLASEEGSNDSRNVDGGGVKDFSNWDANNLTFDEEAIPVTHVIENPNVDSVFISLQLNALSDTAQRTVGTNQNRIEIGSKFASVLNVKVEVGKINSIGEEEPSYEKVFQLTALVESPAIVDIGNPDSKSFAQSSYKYVKQIGFDDNQGDVFNPFVLPSVKKYNVFFEDGIKTLQIPQINDEEIAEKRYIRITRLSTESNSTLINKDVALLKVTEIIPVNLSYPFSSVVGVKSDSRTFGSIPTRTFDCKLKKIRIPSNYRPVLDNDLATDKRYYNTIAEFNATDTEDKRIYLGDWDGTFVEGWTDNPAWVLYDLLTSQRYGLGQYIDESQINKWDLYKIARFCDSVDDDGYFIGTPDGRGGLEPRYSCNIMFQEGTKVFDAINVIAALFRGSVFYNNNEINFLDDRLRDTIAIFSNTNVKDGLFSYSNYRRDEQFNAIEVVYIDRFDDFKTKIEYIEDEADIAQRGIFKKQVNALGVTSKAMARRIGQHLIYQTIKENQSVTFACGLESLLCKPGDLVVVEDELKSLKSNFGRVLEVDVDAQSIRVNESFDASDYTQSITVYTPTGFQTSDDLESLIASRHRLDSFEFTGNYGGFYDEISGNYRFSGYSQGYSGEPADIYPLQNQYAVYTGDNQSYSLPPILYFNTGATGWIFARQRAFTSDNLYDQYISETGVFSLSEMDAQGYLYEFNSALSDYRDAVVDLTGMLNNSSGELGQVYQGVLENEIQLTSTPQITTFSITGHTNETYGATLLVDSGDINVNLLQFISHGSPYRIQRQNSDDQIYKIISISEEMPNLFTVIGTKYDTGKFDLIENDISIELGTDTFGYGANHSVNDVNYEVLSNPTITGVVTGLGTTVGKKITLQWDTVSNATGYNTRLRLPNQTELSSYISGGITSGSFDNVEGIGQFVLAVNALGNPFASKTTRYYDSNYSISGLTFLDVGGLDLPIDNVSIIEFEII